MSTWIKLIINKTKWTLMVSRQLAGKVWDVRPQIKSSISKSRKIFCFWISSWWSAYCFCCRINSVLFYSASKDQMNNFKQCVMLEEQLIRTIINNCFLMTQLINKMNNIHGQEINLCQYFYIYFIRILI